MPRQARRISYSKTYHIILRGNERKNIFKDNEDKICLIDTIQRKVQASESKLAAFCLMNNHVHLVIIEGKEDISKLMQRINVSYVKYFNKKYERIGHLFQDRFKSEVIENERYLLEAVRYIHNNPVKACIVKKPEDYRWSSYNLYRTEKENIIDKKILLNIFSYDQKKAIELFEEFSNRESDRKFIEFEDRKEEIQLEEQQNAQKIIDEFLLCQNLKYDFCMKQKCFRDDLVIELKKKSGLSIRKIAELLDLKRGVVEKAIRTEIKR